jgi:hypothetical protein
MNSMKYTAFCGLLLVISSAAYADDGLNVMLAQITQAYNVDYQQKDMQKTSQFKDQIEKNRLEVERNNNALNKSDPPSSGSTVFARDNYRILPSSCQTPQQNNEFTCYMDNGNYYRVTKLPTGYSWHGFNDAQKVQWSGTSTSQGASAVYSGIDAAGQPFRQICSASACL